MKDDDEVPAFWRALGLPGLFDVHTHFLPDRMMRKVWAHFDAGGPLVGRPWPIRYRGSDAERAGHLRGMGVRHFTALAYAHRPAMAADLNAWTLDFAARTPGCVPSATFYPEPGVPGIVGAALAGGARIFKVHLQVGGYDPNDPLLEPVWGRLAEERVPVVVHAGSGPVANGYTGPGPFGEVLRRHPSLVAVIAHFGAPEYEGFLDLADRYAGVVLDTTMVFTTFFPGFPPELLPRVEELGHAGRVLLGSDFPNIPHPYAHQLDALQRLGFGDDWLRAVCWGNAAGMMER
ncbi:amidohydrolase family protein [Dactylosporangium sp. NPDC005555]|uniref:amidohydrolase family protein n=1 Tax=Dactylosporangium sp. NPDC005555 TaxID=3154889 RepID=UPI0033B81CE9